MFVYSLIISIYVNYRVIDFRQLPKYIFTKDEIILSSGVSASACLCDPPDKAQAPTRKW